MFIAAAQAVLLTAVLPALSGGEDCLPAGGTPPAAIKDPTADGGIHVESLRLSANGYMIDFRYKVLDPEKAAALASREQKPYLIDEASGARFLVPHTPKVGSLRQTGQQLVAGKTYWMLFSNPGKFVKSGNIVTVVIGDFRAEKLKVE